MAKEILQTAEEFYIVASSSRVEERTRVLKHDDTFAVFDRLGDIGAFGAGGGGLYHKDTRFLSKLTIRLGDERPVLLSSTVRRDNALLSADLTNADIVVGDIIAVPKGTLHLFRAKLVWNGTCYERVRIHNYGHLPVSLPLDVRFAADFADIFEVRGMERASRGEHTEPAVGDDWVSLGYRGLDGRIRTARLRFDPEPQAIDHRHARFEMRVGPGEAADFEWTVACETGSSSRPSGIGFEHASDEITRAVHASARGEPAIRTGNELFDQWTERSLADLRMLNTRTSHGPYPCAGVPWFSTQFGRDGLITALETLWFDPSIAKGVLGYLAATQATEDIPSQDAQPGKILHETREGEMALLGEVPFGHYYGSADATPLFVLLAGEHFRRTGDLRFAESMWPNVELALEWMRGLGDPDQDGFIEYERRAENGLVHQGWKDSADPVFHSDGTLAEPPIALCEVQAYAYGALRAAAALARALGHAEKSESLSADAVALQERFERAFWVPDLGTYALALDRHKSPCRVRTSNAGHCLFAGIAAAEHASRVADDLTGESFFSGWGIRTVATTESRYNPMSYHNGSVWPHDNAMIAHGMARYGFKGHAAKVLEGLFESSLYFELHRLPELFCGFHRRPSEGPTLYPVACSPQAWASGAGAMLLQSCLALEVNGIDRTVTFNKPLLPAFLQRVSIRGLDVAGSSVDLELRQADGGVVLDVENNDGAVGVELL